MSDNTKKNQVKIKEIQNLLEILKNTNIYY